MSVPEMLQALLAQARGLLGGVPAPLVPFVLVGTTILLYRLSQLPAAPAADAKKTAADDGASKLRVAALADSAAAAEELRWLLRPHRALPMVVAAASGPPALHAALRPADKQTAAEHHPGRPYQQRPITAAVHNQRHANPSRR